MFQITILTSQSGKEIVKQLERKLKDVDLVSLRRIQVIEVLKRDILEPEDVEQCIPAEEPSSSGECLQKSWLWTALLLAFVQYLPFSFVPFSVTHLGGNC